MRILLIFLFLAAQLTAQDLTLKKGIVTDSLKISDSLNETYALFLPSEFDGQESLPVIFILDGEGRGRSAARLFQAAAEEQGYIIASSNDINGNRSLEQNIISAVRLVQEVNRILPIDQKSISVAGFAEGARVATSLPLVLKDIHGVIYVGDQLFNFEMTENKNHFTAIGVVGNQQVNLGSMEIAALQLRALGYPGMHYVFDGGLEWPDPELISSAIGSLTLASIRSKERVVDPELTTQLYQKDIARARNLVRDQKFLMAKNFLEGLLVKYKGILATNEVKDQLRVLSKSKGFEEQRKHFQEVQEKEERLQDDFLFYFSEDIANSNFENLGWWNYQKLELQKLTEGENQAEAAMAFRLLDLLKRLSKEKLAVIEKQDLAFESKLLTYMLATIFDSENFDAYKKIISLSTMADDYDTSLFYLEEMLKNGYKNLGALYEIEGTLGLKLSREYNWIIKKYLGSSRYFENATNLY